MIVQTGQEVAIKKVRLVQAKEVCLVHSHVRAIVCGTAALFQEIGRGRSLSTDSLKVVMFIGHPCDCSKGDQGAERVASSACD